MTSKIWDSEESSIELKYFLSIEDLKFCHEKRK
jgi:hypothetical protein